MTDTEIADCLLSHLQSLAGLSGARYAETPVRMTGGYDAAIFAFRLSSAVAPFDRALVLRLFGPQTAPQRAPREAAIQNGLAASGFPAPKVFLVENDAAKLGGAFLVMERMPGRPLGSDFEGLQARSVAAAMELLLGLPRMRHDILRHWSDAQARLHAVPVEPFLVRVRETGVTAEELSFESFLHEMRAEMIRLEFHHLIVLLDWLENNRPAETGAHVVCHGDLQPFNVLADGDRMTGVIDWVRAVIADPALDYGAVIAILKTVPIHAPKPMIPFLRHFMQGLARDHTRAFRETHGDRALRYYEVFNCTTQLFTVSRKRTQGDDVTGAYNSTKGLASLTRHIESLTGIRIKLH